MTPHIQYVLATMLLLFTPHVWADTYRYMHVTIDTPWMIFLFLFGAVMMPFILMAILYWRTAFRRNAEDDVRAAGSDVSGKPEE